MIYYYFFTKSLKMNNFKEFETETINISRFVQTWYKQELQEILTDIWINIQPANSENVGQDLIFWEYIWFVYTDIKELIKFNDTIISNLDWKNYFVKWVQFFQGNKFIPANLQVYLSDNKSK